MKAALVLTTALGLVGCSDTCRNTPHQTVRSPDGSLTAVVFDRDCGATNGFNTQVSIGVGEKTPSGKGTVFIADGGTNGGKWGGLWADVTWLGPNHLLIRYDAAARLFLRSKAVEGVEVSFQPIRC